MAVTKHCRAIHKRPLQGGRAHMHDARCSCGSTCAQQVDTSAQITWLPSQAHVCLSQARTCCRGRHPGCRGRWAPPRHCRHPMVAAPRQPGPAACRPAAAGLLPPRPPAGLEIANNRGHAGEKHGLSHALLPHSHGTLLFNMQQCEINDHSSFIKQHCVRPTRFCSASAARCSLVRNTGLACASFSAFCLRSSSSRDSGCKRK